MRLFSSPFEHLTGDAASDPSDRGGALPYAGGVRNLTLAKRGVEGLRRRLARAMLAAAALTAAVSLSGASRPRPSPPPWRLAIYYGYPSLVNGAQGNLERSAAVFAEYDLVVLGDGLEFDTASEHEFAARLVERLRRAPRQTQVYGYVDLGNTQQLSMAQIEDRLARWAAMGAAGVLYDEAGYDFGVTRERQNAALFAARKNGLRVCFNAFRPGDIFDSVPTPLNAVGGGNPRGVPPVISENDALLLESFAVRNGVPETPEDLAVRTEAALRGRDRFGTRIFGVSTPGSPGDDASLADYAWWAATVFGIDAYGWGMPEFSATSSLMPWLPRPDAERTLIDARYGGPLIFRDRRWRRPTTAGALVLDATSRRGAIESWER